MKNSLTFSLPKIDVQHNEIFIDIYENETFLSRFKVKSNLETFVFDECNSGCDYFIEVIPSNFGSVYSCVFRSPTQHYIDPVDSSQITLNEIKINGNKYKMTANHNDNIYETNVILNKFSNFVELFLEGGKGDYIDPVSRVIKSTTIEIYDSNAELCMTPKASTNSYFTFDNKLNLRSFKIVCKILSESDHLCQGIIKCIVPTPSFSKIKHRQKSNSEILFYFSSNKPAKSIKCYQYEDQSKTKLISETEYPYSSFISIPVSSPNVSWFSFDLHDSIGLSDSVDYHKKFNFLENY